MKLPIRSRRLIAVCLVMTALAFPATSHAVLLTYELRATPFGSSPEVVFNGPSNVFAGAGSVIALELYAVLNSGNGISTDDGFLRASGSFFSGTAGGPGTMFGMLRGDSAGGGATLLNNVALFSGSGAQSGFQADLDGDGDLDVGSLAQTGSPAGPPWFLAMGEGQQTQFGTGNTPFAEFLIGRTSFTVTGAILDSHGEASTFINFEPQLKLDGTPGEQATSQFTVDGVSYALRADDLQVVRTQGVFVTGTPEPSACAMALCGAATLAGFRRRRS